MFEAWQDWAPQVEECLTSEIEFKSKEVNQIIAQGEFVGPSYRLQQLLKPLTRAGSPTNIMIKEVPYIDAVQFFNDPSGNRPAHRKRSGSFIEKPFQRQAILTMKHFLENAPNENAAIWHQSLGGAAGRVAPSETAFYYRDAIIAQEYLATWTDPEEERQNIQWIKELKMRFVTIYYR